MQHNVRVTNFNLKPAKGLQMVTKEVDGTAAAIDVSAWPAAKAPYAFISVEGGNARVRWDGEDPDADTGHALYDGVGTVWSRAQITSAKVILMTGSAAATIFASPMTE